MLKSSAHLFLWAFCAIVLVVFGVLAIDLGIVDAAFGTNIQATLHGWWRTLQESYGLHGTRIELAVKVIGVAFTAIFGMLAFVQGLHYAERSLPARLAEFNERIKNVHLQLREPLLAPYASYNLKSDQVVAAPISRVERTLRIFRGDLIERTGVRMVERARPLDEEISVATTNLAKCKAERITAHLVVGSRLAHEARSMEPNTAAQIAQNEAALNEFRKALELDENDLAALEHAAKLARVLNLKPALRGYLEKMERAAQELRRPLHRARALRFQAEAAEERGSTQAARREAYKKLNAALEALDAPDTGPERPYELALVNEQLGSLHIRRGTYTLVAPCLNEAAKLYGELPPPHGPAGLLRIEKLRARLAMAEQGGDEPDDPEPPEDGAYSVVPTHVSIDRVRVFVAAGGKGAAVHTLEPFTAVTRVRTEQGWALIAKGGEPLGYVPEGKMRDLN